MSFAGHTAIKTLMALLFSTLAALPAGASDPASPVGRWQTESGESRYEVSFCGGNRLCARLTWLRSDARTPENLAYLNTYVVKGARQTGAHSWSGTVSYGGELMNGQMILVNADRLHVSGCKLIMCQTMEFERI